VKSKIQQLREQNNLTQSELAEQTRSKEELFNVLKLEYTKRFTLQALANVFEIAP
jgi:transcriptional regulator with XRE-family HTH domain